MCFQAHRQSQSRKLCERTIRLCIKWRIFNYVLSTIDTEENWMHPDREAIQSSILSQCGEILPCSRGRERERTIARKNPARTRNDRNPNAPAYEDLHQQWTQHCEERARVAAWELHKTVYKIRGTYQENKDAFFFF